MGKLKQYAERCLEQLNEPERLGRDESLLAKAYEEHQSEVPKDFVMRDMADKGYARSLDKAMTSDSPPFEDK